MAKKITLIYCYDDFRGFTEDIRKRYSDDERYKIFSFQTIDEFLKDLERAKDKKQCKIAILGAHDANEQIDKIGKLTSDIKDINPRTGIIILGPPEKMDDIRQSVKFNVDAYIPKNANTVLRIHNIVKKLISEHNIHLFRKRRNFSLSLLFTFFIVCILLILIALFKLPQYF